MMVKQGCTVNLEEMNRTFFVYNDYLKIAKPVFDLFFDLVPSRLFSLGWPLLFLRFGKAKEGFLV
ncbi:MAG: hypothetical protein RL711_126 [Bacteroidota bacterium]